MLFEVIPAFWNALSQEFAAFLKAKPLKYIHLSQGDLAILSDVEHWERSMTSALQALDEHPWIEPTGLFASYRKPRLHAGWATALELSGINARRME